MAVEVNRIVRSQRRTLTLIVENDGSVIVRAPLRVSEKAIHEFVESNADWVHKKQVEAWAAPPPSPKRYVAGETFYFLGSAYPLEMIDDQKKSLVLNGCFKLASSAQSNAEEVFRQWYRKQARRVISERLELLAQVHGFQYEKIRITSARTRWGSCSATGTLSFSWRLILAPRAMVDYVLVHELVHTVVHSHSKRFWKKVENIMPDYKEREKWLRKNGGQMML